MRIFVSRLLSVGALFWIGLGSGYAEVSAESPQTSIAQTQLSKVLAPADAITVIVFGESELNTRQRIDEQGYIRMGLIGSFKVAGLSVNAAERALEAAYVEGRFLRSPQVSIQVDSFAPFFISVLGEVSRPGQINLDPGQTEIRLVDAISAAGGFTNIARSNDVRITRILSDGTEKTVVVNVSALISGRKIEAPEEFLIVRPGDVVFVPERWF